MDDVILSLFVCLFVFQKIKQTHALNSIFDQAIKNALNKFYFTEIFN